MSVVLQRNRILAALSPDDRELLASEFESVTLKPREEIYRGDNRLSAVYFPITAVASAIIDSAVLTNIGNEGMLGFPLALGVDRPISAVVVQIGGLALRMEVARFQATLERCQALHRASLKYVYFLIRDLLQSGVCRRFHGTDQRCARWLLQTYDWVGTDHFMLTQQFLAEMMGVRRATVNPALGLLKKQGVIQYVRGRITVLDRKGLEAAACECYRILESEYRRIKLPAVIK